MERIYYADEDLMQIIHSQACTIERELIDTVDMKDVLDIDFQIKKDVKIEVLQDIDKET